MTVKEKIEEKFKNEFIDFPEIKKTTEKIKIICKKHKEEIYITPSELLRERKKPSKLCKKCIVEEELKDTEKIIVDVLFEKRTKVIIHCPDCNQNYIHNKDTLSKNTKCPLCHKWTKEKLEREGKKKYGNTYDYSNSDVISWNTKVKIKCNICNNFFWQTPNNHIVGKGGCQFCNGGRKYTDEEILKKINTISNFKIMSKYIGIFKPLILKCDKCGKTWKAIPNNILHNFQGCPYCSFSKGEKRVEKWLIENKIQFDNQKKFEDLKDKNLLSYDFYLPENNLLIEYNGEQHYKNVFDKSTHDFHIQLHHDWLKRKYAKKNGITLLVIPYWEFDNIERILEEYLKNGI